MTTSLLLDNSRESILPLMEAGYKVMREPTKHTLTELKDLKDKLNTGIRGIKDGLELADLNYKFSYINEGFVNGIESMASTLRKEEHDYIEDYILLVKAIKLRNSISEYINMGYLIRKVPYSRLERAKSLISKCIEEKRDISWTELATLKEFLEEVESNK